MLDSRKPVKGRIIDISAYAFSCQIVAMYASFFNKGEIYHNVLLVIKGARVRTAVVLIGISKVNPEIYVFRYHRENVMNEKTVNKTGLSTPDKNKVHNYIRLCLKEDLRNPKDKIEDLNSLALFFQKDLALEDLVRI